MALKLNADSGRGSCVAVVKRSIAAKEKSLAALLDDAKGANCDGVFSVQFTPATQADWIWFSDCDSTRSTNNIGAR